MEEIKVKVENVFNDDHEIADYFVNAVKNGEVRNFKYNVSKDGDCDFSFERNNKKYVMDTEMTPEFAMEIIEEFQRAAFKYIHKKTEKLSRIIERFKNDRYLKNLFNRCHFNMYDVTDDDFINSFYFSWYTDPNYCPDKQKSDDEIDEIIEKNGGVRDSK